MSTELSYSLIVNIVYRRMTQSYCYKSWIWTINPYFFLMYRRKLMWNCSHKNMFTFDMCVSEQWRNCWTLEFNLLKKENFKHNIFIWVALRLTSVQLPSVRLLIVLYRPYSIRQCHSLIYTTYRKPSRNQSTVHKSISSSLFIDICQCSWEWPFKYINRNITIIER